MEVEVQKAVLSSFLIVLQNVDSKRALLNLKINLISKLLVNYQLLTHEFGGIQLPINFLGTIDSEWLNGELYYVYFLNQSHSPSHYLF